MGQQHNAREKRARKKAYIKKTKKTTAKNKKES